MSVVCVIVMSSRKMEGTKTFPGRVPYQFDVFQDDVSTKIVNLGKSEIFLKM